MSFDKQAIFDQVLAAMRAQGRPSAELAETQDNGPIVKCLYRGPDGVKCGIGHLIPDARYSVDMEGKGVPQLLEVFPMALGRRAPSDGTWSFLADLQGCHDDAARDVKEGVRVLRTGAEFMRCYEVATASLASEYDLTYTPPVV